MGEDSRGPGEYDMEEWNYYEEIKENTVYIDIGFISESNGFHRN